MSREQNVDDLLNLLRNSCAQEDSTDDASEEAPPGEALSTEELQQALRMHYSANGEVEATSADEYRLDEAFMQAAVAAEDADVPWVEEEDASEETEQTIEEAFDASGADASEEDSAALPYVLARPDDVIDVIASDVDESSLDYEEASAEQTYVTGEDGQLSLFEAVADETDTVSEEEIPDLLFSEYLLNEYQVSIDFGIHEEEEEEEEEEETSDAESTATENAADALDDDTIRLILEMGYTGAVKNAVKEDRIREFVEHERQHHTVDIDPGEAFAFSGDEYESQAQNEEIMLSYSKEKLWMLLRVLASGLLAALLSVYELLPLFGVRFGGIFAYGEYPVTALSVSVPLLLACGVISWRELWRGLRKSFSFRAEAWSLVAIGYASSLLYQVLMMVLVPAQRPITYNFLAAISIFIGLLADYMRLLREIRAFTLYSDDSAKYTAVSDCRAGSLAAKMYRGGLPREKNVLTLRDVQFPKGYFSGANKKREEDPLICYCIAPILVIGVVIGVIGMIRGTEMHLALSSVMLTYFCIAPFSTFFLHSYPIFGMSKRLYRRQCAVLGEAVSTDFADCDVMIFNDTHLFKKVAQSECGIVLIDKENTHKILCYLKGLYAKIGGPMQNTFSNIPDHALHSSVLLRRIARNGVEAVGGGADSILLGDMTFLNRYGIDFPEEGKGDSRHDRICLVVNGKPAAVLLVRYRTEPIFEMLAQSLANEDVDCVVATYDPLISGSLVAACREHGARPISVIHKNMEDYRKASAEDDMANTEVIACGSRLKLVECVVWCKRLLQVLRMGRMAQVAIFAASIIGTVALSLLAPFHPWMLAVAIGCQLLGFLTVVLLAKIFFPSKKYFTVATQNAIRRKHSLHEYSKKK